MKKFPLLVAVMLMSDLISAQWIIQQNPYYPDTCNLSDIFFIDDNYGWSVGGYDGDFPNPPYCVSLGTMNGGNEWEPLWGLSAWLNCPGSGVFFTDHNNGWVVSHCGEIIHTKDGGFNLLSWEPQASNTECDLNCVFFLDSLNGWAAGSQTSGLSTYFESVIIHTDDGGINWSTQYEYGGFEIPESFPQNIAFINYDTGYAFGTWNYLSTNDGGNYWMWNLGFGTINSIYFTDKYNGWIVGETVGISTGTIYHTNDGGNSWVQQFCDSCLGLKHVSFADTLNGWAVGYLGTIIHTSDGGQSWEIQESGTTTTLNSVCFIDTENGWICGDSSIILYTDNGGIVGLNQNPKSKSKLKIFPNPSKEMARITFELIKKEASIISILNKNGQEVKLIHLGEIEKGHVDIDCSMFPPGIYLVSLKNDEEIITEKLIIE